MKHFSWETIRKLRQPTTENSAYRKTRMILGCGLTVAYCSWSAAEDFRRLVSAGVKQTNAMSFQQNMMARGFHDMQQEVLNADEMCDKYIDLHANFRSIVEAIQSYGIFPFELKDYEDFCKSVYDGYRLVRYRQGATCFYPMYSSDVLNYSEGSISETDLVNNFVVVDFVHGRKRPILPFEFRQYLCDLSLVVDEMWLIYGLRKGENETK